MFLGLLGSFCLACGYFPISDLVGGIRIFWVWDQGIPLEDVSLDDVERHLTLFKDKPRVVFWRGNSAANFRELVQLFSRLNFDLLIPRPPPGHIVRCVIPKRVHQMRPV